jgi:hypothetical protein
LPPVQPKLENTCFSGTVPPSWRLLLESVKAMIRVSFSQVHKKGMSRTSLGSVKGWQTWLGWDRGLFMG